MSGSNRNGSLDSFSCPPPASKDEVIVLGHGSGGRLTAELVSTVFLPALSNPLLDRLNDSAEMKVGASRIAFTTDSFVVNPLRFPGWRHRRTRGQRHGQRSGGGGQSADRPVGRVHPRRGVSHRGTRSDRRIDARGGRPRGRCGNRGGHESRRARQGRRTVHHDQRGIGVVAGNIELGPERIQVGDAVLVSGPIGDHGIAVMSAREGLEFQTTTVSDSAPLNGLVSSMLESGGAIRCMRDPTRGGVATVINELAKSSRVEILIEETAVPVRDGVRAACEILGLDPLYVACEGRLVAIVDSAAADNVLAAMRRHPLGSNSCRIGIVTRSDAPRVLLRTAFGTTVSSTFSPARNSRAFAEGTFSRRRAHRTACARWCGVKKASVMRRHWLPLWPSNPIDTPRKRARWLVSICCRSPPSTRHSPPSRSRMPPMKELGGPLPAARQPDQHPPRRGPRPGQRRAAP